VLSGHLDLFGANPALRVKGDVTGAIDGAHLDLQGDAVVALGTLTLSSGHLHLTESLLSITGRWFDTFDAALKVDSTFGRVVVTGSITGGVLVDVPFPAQYIPTPQGPVKVCDGFTMSTGCDLDLAVQADEIGGLFLEGDAGVTIADVTVNFRLELRVAPSDITALKQLVIDQLLGQAQTIFQSLFSTAKDWVTGVVTGAIAWTRGAWDDTAAVLKNFFGQTASQAVGLLDAAHYQADEIGRVLNARFTSDSAGLVKAFADAGAGAVKAGQAAYAVFEKAFDRDVVTAANSVAAMVRQSFGSQAVASTVRSMFPIDNATTLQILTNQRFIPREVADAARNTCKMSLQDTATAFKQIGIATDAAVRGLTSTYTEVSSSTVAACMQAAGYATSTLNSVLRSIGLPTI
jgi:hypothetical protein